MRVLLLLQRARTASDAFYNTTAECDSVDATNSVAIALFGFAMLLCSAIRLLLLPLHLALKLVPPCEHPQLRRWQDWGGYSNTYCPDCKYRD